MKAPVVNLLMIWFRGHIALSPRAQFTAVSRKVVQQLYATMPKGIMGNEGLWYLIEALGVLTT